METVSCQSCQYENTLLSAHTTHVSCANCSAIVSTETGAVCAQNKRKNIIPWGFLRKGQTFTYQGEHYTIVGWTEVKVEFELDTLEPEEGTWRYQEWFCLNKKGDDELVITQDREGYFISRVFEGHAETEFSWTSKYLSFQKDHTKRPRYERGIGYVQHFEGEATFPVHNGLKFYYMTYRYNSFTYGVEFTNIEDVGTHAYYAQTTIWEDKLLKMIKKENELTEWASQENEFNYLKGALLAASVVSILFLFASWFSNGTVFYQTSKTIGSITEDGLPTDSLLEVTDINTVYNLELGVKLYNENTETVTAVEVINENGNVINLLMGEFYRAAGVSGGESWSESATSVDSYVKFDEPGSYRFVFYKENVPTPKPLASSDYVYLKIRKGDLLTRYFLTIFCFFALLLWLSVDFSTAPFIRLKYLRFLAYFSKK